MDSKSVVIGRRHTHLVAIEWHLRQAVDLSGPDDPIREYLKMAWYQLENALRDDRELLKSG